MPFDAEELPEDLHEAMIVLHAEELAGVFEDIRCKKQVEVVVLMDPEDSLSRAFQQFFKFPRERVIFQLPLYQFFEFLPDLPLNQQDLADFVLLEGVVGRLVVLAEERVSLRAWDDF